MVISRMYSEKCGYRDGVARIVTISGGGCRKLMDPVWCSEKVLNPEMRGDPSSDSEYRTGFVWNPGRRAKICSISALVLNINNKEHPLYSFSATGDREREVRTAFLALLRLEAAFINIRAFARARVKPNSR